MLKKCFLSGSSSLSKANNKNFHLSPSLVKKKKKKEVVSVMHFLRPKIEQQQTLKGNRMEQTVLQRALARLKAHLELAPPLPPPT